jgi:DNA primase
VGVEPEDSLIYKLFCEWFGEWDIPDNRGEWNKMCCPWHGDTRASSSISYDNDAFVCRACDVKGDALSLIMRKEDCGFQDSKLYAERILGKSYEGVQGKPARKSGRRVFGKSQAANPRKSGKSFTFPDWIR